MIIVARRPAREPLGLFPLCTRDVFGLRVAEFFCGRESNINIGLLRPGAVIDPEALLLAAARRQAKPPDLFYLRNQPATYENVSNQLAQTRANPSPSFAYGSPLPVDLATLEQQFSRETRKKLRSKQRRLELMGSLVLEHEARGARAREIVAALVAQKSARLAMMGVGGAFDQVTMQAFLDRICDAGALEAHALSVSGRIVATYVGLVHRGRFSALLNSFEMEATIARYSPCDLLLHAVLRNLVERGFTYFDLGAGEARYKSAVCEDTIQLYDAVIPATDVGAMAAPMFQAFLTAKRTVKQTSWLAQTLGKSRRLLRF
jgi:CelD/BcsL family acetyltransferase involved in cellulose biosynthesis